MQNKVLVGLLVVLLLAAGCGSAGTSTPTTSTTPVNTSATTLTTQAVTPTTTPATSSANTTTSPATSSTKTATSPTTSLNPNVPTPALLAKQNFINPNIPRITCEEFKVMYDDNTPYSLVDTRLKSDYDDEHIRSARSVPNGDVNVVSESCIATLKQLPKDKMLVLYCD
jgi:rhodanese-related sulfurtransferase